MAVGQGGYSTDGITIATVDQVGGNALVSVDTQAPNGSSPQTLAMTLAQIQVGSFGTIAAAGATQGDATAITTQTVIVSATASTEGVLLPTAATGAQVRIFVSGTVGTLVYPNTGDAIEAGATNAGDALAAAKAAVYLAKDATTWLVQRGS